MAVKTKNTGPYLELGQRLRLARHALELSQDEVGAQLGMTSKTPSGYVSKVELGQVNISIKRLRAFAHVLGQSVHDLIPEGW